MLSSDASQYQPGISKVMRAPLYSRTIGRTRRCIGAPVFGQTGLFIVFSLERQQQKLGHDISREFDVERAYLRRHVIDVLPNPMISVGGHRFEEVRAVHSLN